MNGDPAAATIVGAEASQRGIRLTILAGGWRFGWLVGTDPATGALRDAAATAAWVTGADSAELLRLIVAALDEPQPEEAA